MGTMKVLELFCGYGTATFALKALAIPHEVVGYSDIDKYANQCFQQNHGGKELGDCTKINPDDLEDFDLLTGGFPCQSFSNAGKGLGELDARGTLFNEIIRIAEVKQPRYMMLENVKGLTFKKHKQTFDKIVSELYRIGYFVKWKILNTKDYGIPQSRDRIFFCCFKSWTDFCNYEWPEKEELKILLCDILEKEVDDKYNLSEKQIDKLREYLGKKNKINKEIINCIGTCFGRSGSSSEECESFIRTNAAILDSNKIKYEQLDINGKGHNSQRDRFYYVNGICPTLHTKSMDIKLMINKSLMIGNLSRYKMKSERSMPFKEDGVSWCLTGNCDVGVLQNYRLRKLTPIECFRLQGFLNDEVNLEGLSNTQRYKLAGNGQSVNVVKKIFANMFGSQKDGETQ